VGPDSVTCFDMFWPTRVCHKEKPWGTTVLEWIVEQSQCTRSVCDTSGIVF
jgi:hypothetical protein